jgi:SsrA-binding protein
MIKNKKAFYDYEILEQYECGMKLEGWEVKAIANKAISIAGSHCVIMSGDVMLVGTSIGSADQDMMRSRKLLLHKKEISSLIGKVKEKGLTLVPLSVYTKNGKYKLSMGLVKGKKEYDKRESEKKRDIENETRRIVKSQKFDNS